MNRTTLLILLIFASCPLAVFAQSWTPEQQSVWDAEVACLDAGIDDIAARRACVHPDFVGWGVQQPAPIGYSENEFNNFFARNKVKAIEAIPLHILVEGDLAIIQLIVRDITSPDDGPDKESWTAWTDIMHRENGKWRWIADHGHLLLDR